MTTKKKTANILSAHIRGFLAHKPILATNGKMVILDIGVESNPLKPVYFEVKVFGPAAQAAVEYLDRGSIAEVSGALNFSARQGKRGKLITKLSLVTDSVKFCKRGEEHFARLTAVGNLGANPQSSKTANGTVVASFDVAVNRTVRGKERTDWIAVTTFGRSATACLSYLHWGGQVKVVGPLGVSRWTARDGKVKAGLSVQASSVDFLAHPTRRVDSGAAVGEAEEAVPV